MGLDTDLYDIDDWYDGKYKTHKEVIEQFLEGTGLSIEDIEEIKRKNDPDNKISRYELGESNYLVAHLNDEELKEEEEIERNIANLAINDDEDYSSEATVEKIIAIRQESEMSDNDNSQEKRNKI
ncbi:MAG: hypothetical protein Q8M10_00760 [Methylotenera sp.]|uniref:hypothetical protein n=1 Tax=Methylotenera sp. TaxID=2051956 RepID=UPI00272FE481|nr:hypothetical protein [Methylotenera sp.]MDP1521662.1 hypothetical protein [Methylotenera sp.]